MSRGTKKESLPSRWLNEGSTNFAVLNQKDPNPRTNLMRRENITDIKKYRRTQRKKPLLQLGPLPEAESYKRKVIELFDQDLPKRKSHAKRKRSRSKEEDLLPITSESSMSVPESKDEETADELPDLKQKFKSVLSQDKRNKITGIRALLGRSFSKRLKLPSGMKGGKRRKSTRKIK